MEGGTVSNYANGLRISGGYAYQSYGQLAGRAYSPIRYAEVKDAEFTRIGSKFAGGPGFAALHIQNTSGALVEGVSVRNAENTSDKASNMHAVYSVLANVDVFSSSFNTVSGDAVRARHKSNVVLSSSSIQQAGRYGALTDWFCDAACAQRTSQSFECPSSLSYVGNSKGRSYYGGSIPDTANTISHSGAHSSC